MSRCRLPATLRAMVIACLFPSVCAHAAPGTAMSGPDWIRHCALAYRKLNSLTARIHFRQEIVESSVRAPQRGEADIQLAFQRPDRFFATHTAGKVIDRIFVCDGKRCVIYRPDVQEYAETEFSASLGNRSFLRPAFSFPPGTGLVLQLLHEENPESLLTLELQSAEVIGLETIEGRQTCLVILSYPWDRVETGLSPETSVALKGKTARVKLWIDSEDFLLRQTEIDLAPAASGFDPQGSPPLRWILTETFNECISNPLINPGRFLFQPPRGARLVESFGEGRPVDDLIGKEVPDLTLKDLRGPRVRLSSFRGKTALLLCIWSSVSPPSARLFPLLETIHKTYRKKGLSVIGISLDPRDVTRETLSRYRLTFRSLIDLDVNDGVASYGQVMRAFNVIGVPRMIIVDRDGIVRSDRLGSVSEKLLKEDLANAGIQAP